MSKGKEDVLLHKTRNGSLYSLMSTESIYTGILKNETVLENKLPLQANAVEVDTKTRLQPLAERAAAAKMPLNEKMPNQL